MLLKLTYEATTLWRADVTRPNYFKGISNLKINTSNRKPTKNYQPNFKAKPEILKRIQLHHANPIIV